MTTDVINGVPRELRALVEQFNSLDVDEYQGWACRVYDHLIDLLATAQPAADGEREQFEAVYAAECERELRNGTTATDIANLRVGDGYGSSRTYLNAQWIGWQARAAQPQQAVAVTDEVRRLREALERLTKGVALETSVDWNCNSYHPALIEAQGMALSALSAHKTGEEE